MYNGRIIEVTQKPRILRHPPGGWMCVGLRCTPPRLWFRAERVVTTYGETPLQAYAKWVDNA